MPDPGGITAHFFWAAKSQQLPEKDPQMEIVCIPLNASEEGIYVTNSSIQMQILRTNCNDKDLAAVQLGDCCGFVNVYPGYTSKRMEPPKDNIRNFPIDWCTFYADDKYYFFRARIAQPSVGNLGEMILFDWGFQD